MEQWVSRGYWHPADRSQFYAVGCWPVSVTGTVQAYYTQGAEDVAAGDLDRLCQLLSLATGWRWIHFLWPEVGPRGQRPVCGPVDEWAERAAESPVQGLDAPEPTVLEIAEWVPAAWPKLSSAARSGALEAYSSAICDITDGRPSAAGAQFMAVLEKLSREGNAGGVDGEAARKRAVEMVAEFLFGSVTAEDKACAGEVMMYGRRSGTVHGGRRYGSEQRLNMPMRMHSLDGDPLTDYERQVERLRFVCQALLVKDLGGPLLDPAPVLQEMRHFEEGVIWL
ncbi:hypothetical protein [Streptomyces californicus]|uniref:hypothetical protein n=1 Tax=Streptomyces californicus TaxID=67351 RepID=UPI0037B5EF2C